MRIFLVMSLMVLASVQAMASDFVSVKPVSLPTVGANGQNNGTWNMADAKNGVFVFEAFANFCSYCNDNAPRVDALATKWKDEPRVQVLDLGLDKSPRDYAAWIQRHKPNHPVLNDSARKLFGQLTSSSSIPQTFVVDCAGNILEKTLGAWSPSMIIQINDAIREALQTVCTTEEQQ